MEKDNINKIEDYLSGLLVFSLFFVLPIGVALSSFVNFWIIIGVYLVFVSFFYI